jgi:uncharacterized protein YegP (UPF0339 family)
MAKRYSMEVFPGTRSGWHWRLDLRNGEKGSTSERYERPSAARKRALSIAKDAGWVVRILDKKGNVVETIEPKRSTEDHL